MKVGEWGKNPIDFGAELNHRADTQTIFHFSRMQIGFRCGLAPPPWFKGAAEIEYAGQ